jgi:hypothetical protein
MDAILNSPIDASDAGFELDFEALNFEFDGVAAPAAQLPATTHVPIAWNPPPGARLGLIEQVVRWFNRDPFNS